MEDLKKELKSEIDDFKKLGYQFLNKEISVAQFKGSSGGMGVYAQRDAKSFMIRLRTQSGIVTYENLKLIYNYALKYNLDHIHLTTRQAIQLHNLSIDDVCDIMNDAIDHNLFTRGGGGNFPRNVSLSPLSGVERGEAFDVTPYALQAGEYLIRKITKYKLPRKLKIAFSSSNRDTANSRINDLGFLAVVVDNKPYFKLYLAGGLGNNPSVSIEYNKLVEPTDILYHIEAFTQLFIAEGDYDNKAKARTRYIPRRMGVESFLECYENHLKTVKETSKFMGIETVIEPITPATHNLAETDSLIRQKQSNLYSVKIHPLNGQLKVTALKDLIDFLSNLNSTSIRISMEEDMYIRNLNESQAIRLLDLVSNINQTDKISQSVSCIGVPTCQMGIEKSQTLLVNILNELNNKGISKKMLPSIHISGCNNSCSRHQTCDLGFAGRKKKVNDKLEDGFEVYISGKISKDQTKLGESIGFMLMSQIPDFICELALELEAQNVEISDFVTNDKFKSLSSKYLV